MVNYYKHGNTVYRLDLENNTVMSFTNSEHSRAMTYSDNAPEAAQIMSHHFSASLNTSTRGDYPVVVSDESEFISAKATFKQYLTDANIEL